MPYAKRKLYKKSNKPINKMAPKSDTKAFRFKQGKPYGIKPEPFPRELITRCKYAENGKFVLSSTPDLASSLTYKTNGLYQPLYTTGDHTATGYSVLASVYDNYICYGCKVQVTFYDPLTDGITVGVRLRSQTFGSTLSSTVEQLLAQPLTYTSEINNTGSQRKTFNFFVTPWSLNGMSKLEYMANRVGYSGHFGTNSDPTYPAYIDIFACHPETGSQTVRYAIKMVYYIRCFNRKNLTYTSYTP